MLHRGFRARWWSHLQGGESLMCAAFGSIPRCVTCKNSSTQFRRCTQQRNQLRNRRCKNTLKRRRLNHTNRRLNSEDGTVDGESEGVVLREDRESRGGNDHAFRFRERRNREARRRRRSNGGGEHASRTRGVGARVFTTLNPIYPTPPSSRTSNQRKTSHCPFAPQENDSTSHPASAQARVWKIDERPSS